MFITPKELTDEFHLDIKGVVHVGACTAEELPLYEEIGVNKVIWIEANPSLYHQLCGALGFRVGHSCYCFACANESGKIMELNITNNLQSSSILPLKKHKDFYPDIAVTQKARVPSLRLDDFFDAYGFSLSSYNFLNLDIQGAELLALQGAPQTLGHIKYIYTEVNEEELYEKCALIDEIDEYLRGFGFSRVKTHMTKEKWGDAFYMYTG